MLIKKIERFSLKLLKYLCLKQWPLLLSDILKLFLTKEHPKERSQRNESVKPPSWFTFFYALVERLPSKRGPVSVRSKNLMFTVDLIKFIYKCLSLITSQSRPNGLTGKAMISAKSVMSVGKTECSVHVLK